MENSKFIFTKKSELTLPIVLSLLIAFAFPIDPLFSSNQNIYLLHSIAEIFGPPLANDWLANQTDPFPIFTWLTRISYMVSPILLYAYHVILSFILIFSLYIVQKKSLILLIIIFR